MKNKGHLSNTLFEYSTEKTSKVNIAMLPVTVGCWQLGHVQHRTSVVSKWLYELRWPCHTSSPAIHVTWMLLGWKNKITQHIVHVVTTHVQYDIYFFGFAEINLCSNGNMKTGAVKAM